MSVKKKRQHLLVDDHIYFDFRVIKRDDFCSDHILRNELFGKNGQKYFETLQYFQRIDDELANLSNSLQESSLLHFINLLHAKIDFLSHQLIIPADMQRQKVNMSLDGLAFRTEKPIKEKTCLKIILYIKPKFIPIIVDATVVYSQYQSDKQYRTAVSFNELTMEQENLLSQHLLLAQAKCPTD